MSAKETRETRCYALTGTAQSLDMAERILQALERAESSEEPRLLVFALDGGTTGGVRLKTLATWEEE